VALLRFLPLAENEDSVVVANRTNVKLKTSRLQIIMMSQPTEPSSIRSGKAPHAGLERAFSLSKKAFPNKVAFVTK
jgi:hypothetical protein